MKFSKNFAIFLLWSQNPQLNIPVWVRWVDASPFFQIFLKSLKHLEQFSYLCGLHMIKTRRATRSAKSSGLVTKNRILAIFWVKCIVFGFFAKNQKNAIFDLVLSVKLMLSPNDQGMENCLKVANFSKKVKKRLKMDLSAQMAHLKFW